MTIGCLWVPALGLQAVRRAEPELAERPLALLEGEAGRTRVVAASSRALQAGVGPGLTALEAEARCEGLVLRRLAPGQLEDARDALLDAAAQVSPRVEPGPLGGAADEALVHVDTDGLERLFGGPRSQASALVVAAGRVGLWARAALAGSKAVARIAARLGGASRVVAAGEERAFLAPLPLAALEPEPALAEALHRWGIHTAGQLAALPALGLGGRLGEEGLRLHRLACGESEGPLVPLPAPERFAERTSLDWGVSQVEPLLFVLRPLLERLVQRLGGRGLALGSLTLQLQLDPTGETTVPVALAAPTNAVGPLLTLCRLALEARPPRDPVRGVVALAGPARLRTAQLGLWERPRAAPMQVMTAVAQVAALLGPQALGRLQLPEGHTDPEPGRLLPFDPPEAPAAPLPPPRDAPTPTSAARSAVALRRYTPPLPVEVREGELPGSHERGPLFLSARGLAGRVVQRAGPWRTEVGWHARPVQRDLWDVALAAGGVFRLQREPASAGGSAWSVVGRYD